MVVVLGMWERWVEPERTERRLWKQTLTAFGVDRWGMCDVRGGPFTSPVQFVDLKTMLAAYPGPKTFLIPPGRIEGSVSLAEYKHPAEAIYVFGNSAENLVRSVTPVDDVVSIYTPARADLFGIVVVGAVLYDRMVKQ